METVGIRELKENLGRYMGMVRAGKKIVITDRRKGVAIIMPMENKEKDEKIYQLIRRGIASWSGGRPRSMPERIAPRGNNVSSAVIEDRR